MKTAHYLSLILVLIGAINWGLVGFFHFDLVAFLFGGQDATMSRIVYSLVGVAALVLIGTLSAMHSGEPRTLHRQQPMAS